MSQDTFLPSTAIGSTDWAGGTAPAGGTHTGTSIITMTDGVRFTVASNRAEVLRKLSLDTNTANPQWIAFDVPNVAIPVILDGNLIASVI